MLPTARDGCSDVPYNRRTELFFFAGGDAVQLDKREEETREQFLRQPAGGDQPPKQPCPADTVTTCSRSPAAAPLQTPLPPPLQQQQQPQQPQHQQQHMSEPVQHSLVLPPALQQQPSFEALVPAATGDTSGIAIACDISFGNLFWRDSVSELSSCLPHPQAIPSL